MTFSDKNGRLQNLCATNRASLELGCGASKKHPNAISVDALDYPCVDVVGDVFEVIDAIPDSCIDDVYSYHFIEHIDDLYRLLAELARVVRPGGRLDFVAPHFSNPYFYSDPTHRRFFGLYTLCYFSSTSPFRRKVPTYGHALPFAVRDVQLNFKSDGVFPGRYALKKVLGSVFNASTYMRELYEENFATLLPCYEVRYLLCRQ